MDNFLETNLDKLPIHMKLSILSLVNQSQAEQGSKTTGITDPSKLLPPITFFKNEKGETIFDESKLSFFTKESLEKLEKPGYYIFDNFLGKEKSKNCFVQANSLYESGILNPSSMSKGNEKWKDEKIRGDYIVWFNNSQKENFQKTHPDLYFLYKKIDDLSDELDKVSKFNCQKKSTQLTCYPGKQTRYVRHLDAFLGNSNSDRKLTLLYYMNPDWNEKKGGKLKIYLEEGGAIEIEPKEDRLLIFQSRRLEHEVLPVFEKRFATTVWLY